MNEKTDRETDKEYDKILQEKLEKYKKGELTPAEAFAPISTSKKRDVDNE